MVRLLRRWIIDLSPSTGHAIGAASARLARLSLRVAKDAIVVA